MNKKLKTIIAGCVILTTSIGGIQIIKSMNNQLTYKEKALNSYEDKAKEQKDSICKMIDEIAPQYDIPTDFAKALIYLASGFDPNADGKDCGVGNMTGVAMVSGDFARQYGLIVNNEIDERKTEPEKVLHAVFKDLDFLRNYVKEKTGKDDLMAAYSLQSYGIVEYLKPLSEGRIPHSLIDNTAVSAIKSHMRYF